MNMNSQMNGGASWHSMYSVTDRQKVVQLLTNSLKELQGANFNEQKAASMASDFEKYTFMKAQSRDEYLRIIKQKMTQLRNGVKRTQPPSQQQQPPAQMPNMNQNVNPQNYMNMRQQQGQQQQPQQQPLSQPQPQQHPQQAQQPPPAQTGAANGNNGQNGGNAPTNQQTFQQISNVLRTVPIPPALLAKIPNLPPNVNTWNQIFDCINKKIIPTTSLGAIKEIHNAHLQVALRQHHQRKMAPKQAAAAANRNGMGVAPNMAGMDANNGGANINMNNNMPMNNNMNMGNMGSNFNLNNLTPQQKQQLMQRQMQQKQQQQQQRPNQQSQPNSQPQPPQAAPQQPRQQFNQQAANRPNTQGPEAAKPPAFNITQQDIMKYSSEAMMVLSRLQANGSFQNNLDQAQKDNFIRRFIVHQKSLQAKQQQQQQQQQGGSQPTSSMMGSQMNLSQMNQGQMNLNQQQQAQVQAQQAQAQAQAQQVQQRRMQQQQQAQGQVPPQIPQQSPLMGNNMNMNQSPLMKQNQMNLTSPMLNQRQTAGQPIPGQPASQQPTRAQSIAPGVGPGVNGAPSNPTGGVLPAMTDEMKQKLRQLMEEVSRNHVALSEVTGLLSPAAKNTVRENMFKISQEYASVDSVISCFFILTKNIEGTKRLIQMKFMTKTIMENLQRGTFLASPDLTEKLRAQYLKYFDYVKEQLAIRRQQLQSQQQSQHMPQTQPQPQPQNQQNMYKPMSQQPPQAPVTSHPQQLPVQAPHLQQPMPAQQGFNWNNNNGNNQPSVVPQSIPSTQPLPAGLTPQQNNMSPALNNTAGAVPASMTSPVGGRAKGKRASTSAQARRKSNKGTATTPGADVPTPATLANAIKTPNSIPTPQVPQTQSNKNTPAEQNSPNFQNKGTTKLNEHAIGDIFSSANNNGSQDFALNKRRELSDQDPERFFFASLANLLEIDEPQDKGLPTPSPSSNGGSSVKSVKLNDRTTGQTSASSPNEWTATVKPEAIVSSFKQICAIREAISVDILKECGRIEPKKPKAEGSSPNSNGISIKRERNEEEDDDLDMLFNDKKPKTEPTDNDDYSFLLNENLTFDEWKTFVSATNAIN